MKKVNMIFLHGGPGFSNYLQMFFQDIHGSVNSLFYDQLKGERVSIDDLVDELDNYVNSLKGETWLVGHSWGATLALEYTSRFENKISGLVLMSFGLSLNHWEIEFDLEKKRLGLTSVPPEKVFLTEEERAKWPGFLDEIWKPFSNETFHSLYNGYIKKHDLTDKFSELKLPILTIFGSEDIRFGSRIATSLFQLNPNINQLNVDGAGHFPFLIESNRKKIIDNIFNIVK